ncbi:RNA polymerase sigma factor, sigma-70 family [Desulfitobacterium dehalogenans ATCC 51507]|uniref:RNA polymerase sigma factor, sigma-70 family n=1 Tax=Desulfitobacterium dehalogenans (strain ATCC 51507 / DSM 9161 / JW/IU-DC1) TaxID=756499 RepID=I4A543_DESDJ|nr:sigma-70 region 4 domain-containing protein [Desulfitobacterium dehalogenans]AFL99077.1 RNA polymerase sigma factor, sigma-70 family [Desulfitobacterium dehalogenans ATCC 51507]
MTLLPVLLFISGVLCLIWAVRMGNSSGKTSPEILTILQGLAGVKKEISKVQKGLREVETQLGDHELRLFRNENVQEDLRTEVNTQKVSINRLTTLAKDAFAQAEPQPQMNPQPYFSANPLNSAQGVNPYHRLYDNSNAPTDSPLETLAQTTKFPQYSPSFLSVEEESPSPMLPEKYQWVLELDQQGWSVAEIAGHLAISRDAVTMVLRTAPQGKGLRS